MTSSQTTAMDDVTVELITDEADIRDFYECTRLCFGEQTNDGFWVTLNPAHDTPDGHATHVAAMTARWQKEARDAGTSFFVKATRADPDDSTGGTRQMVGTAIWVEARQDRNPPAASLADAGIDVHKLHPGSEREQRFAAQMFASLYKRRCEIVAAAGREARAVLILDSCAVHPAFQGRGIGRKVVQWGLDYAATRGPPDAPGLECYTEASVMGRPVYEKMGFVRDSDVVWAVDDEFKHRRCPPNTHLRRFRRST